MGEIRYLPRTTEGTPYLRYKNIEIDIVQPPGRAGDTDFIEYITRAVMEVIPFALEIKKINIIAPVELFEYQHVGHYAQEWAWVGV